MRTGAATLTLLILGTPVSVKLVKIILKVDCGWCSGVSGELLSDQLRALRDQFLQQTDHMDIQTAGD